MVAAPTAAPDSRGHWPDALARRLFVVMGLLLLAAFAALAPRLHNVPADLAPMWMGAGVATLLALRLRSWPATLCLAGAMWLGAAVAREQGLPVPGLALLAAMAASTALQARASAICMSARLGGMLFNPRLSAPEQLGQLVNFLLRCVLLQSLLAGAVMGVLQALASPAAMAPWTAVQLGLQYAGASGLSIVLFTPMGGRWVWRLPARVVAGVLWLASAALAWLATGLPQALYLAPVIALASGYFGGMRLTLVCAATLAASLMLGVNFAHLPPFEGPDGFVVLLLFVWRLVGIGFFTSVWTERRQQARVAAAMRPGALQCRDPEHLLRHFRTSVALLVTPTMHHGWVCFALAAPTSDGAAMPMPMHGPDEVELDISSAPLVSARLHAAMRAIARVLRPGDGVLPLTHDKLLVVLPGLPPEHLMRVAARMSAALAHRDEALPGMGRLTDARVMGVHAVQCLLQSQAYFALEQD